MSIAFDGTPTADTERAAPWLSHYPFCIPARLDYPQEPVWWLLERAASSFRTGPPTGITRSR